MIPCYLSNSRIGYEGINLYEDKNGTNWMYFSSNSTLIFDKLYITTSRFNIYFSFAFLEENIGNDKANFTLILKNENTIIVNRVDDLVSVSAFEFIGHFGNKLIIKGDGKLIIKFDAGKKDLLQTNGFYVSYSDLVIKENAKIEIIMNNADEFVEQEIFDASLNMEDNSQVSVLLTNCLGRSFGYNKFRFIFSKSIFGMV